MWVIQEVARNFDYKYSFGELVDLAKENMDFDSVVDVDDDRFLKPENMILEIQKYCFETEQRVPKTAGEIAICVYNSLAYSYKKAVEELEEIFEKKFKRINIFGGGCQNNLLNEIVAKVTGKEVLAGPIEATAIGNLAAQMIKGGEYKDLADARKAIKDSFDIKTFN